MGRGGIRRSGISAPGPSSGGWITQHRQLNLRVYEIGASPDSGTLRRRRIVTGGRAPVRRVLYMATITAIRRNPPIAAFYQRLRAAGRPAKVALTAAMRKLLTILNAIPSRSPLMAIRLTRKTVAHNPKVAGSNPAPATTASR